MRDHSDKNDGTPHRVPELSRDAENVDGVIEDTHHGGSDHYPKDASFAAPQAATAQNGSGNGIKLIKISMSRWLNRVQILSKENSGKACQHR